MSAKFERKAYVVSPHQDDAVLSIGMILREYGRVDIANLFTLSDSHILPNVDMSKEAVSLMRHEEDKSVGDAYGFNFHDAGLPDSEIRGVAWDDYWAEIDGDLVDASEQFIRNVVTDNEADLYIPSAFGLHPDHLIAHIAGIRALGSLGIQSWFLYGDQPYYSLPTPVRNELHDHLSISRRNAIPFSATQKKPMLAAYPSQLSTERVDRMAQTGNEYIWRGDDDMRALSVSSERYRQEAGVFGAPSWQDASRQHHPAAVHDVHTTFSSNGERIDIPVMTDIFCVGTDDEVPVLRLEGAGWFDYADFDAAESLDDTAWSGFIEKARQSDADLLWISGIREDSTLYRLLESGQHKGHLIAAESSYMIDCHKQGFDAWVNSLRPRMRRKVRSLGRKRTSFINEGGSIYQGRATSDDVDAFLDLQQMRARSSEGKLDAFIDDDAYCSFLRELATKEQLGVVRMDIDSHTIGTMLFHHSAGDNSSISIINQGFDPQYSHYAPGFVMQIELIQSGHRLGVRTVDLLKGDEPYKKEFSNRDLRLFKYIEPLRDMSRIEWIKYKKLGESYIE